MAKQAETDKTEKKRSQAITIAQDKQVKDVRIIGFGLCRFRKFTVKCDIAAHWRQLEGRDVAAATRGAFNERNETIEWSLKMHGVIH